MSIEQKRHEGFEAYIKSTPQSNLISLERTQVDDGYADAEVHWSWLAWNAALDSVVVELPGKDKSPSYDLFDTGFMAGFDSAIEICQDAIESAGLKVKS